MKLNKPLFWDKKLGVISILLYPISLILSFIIKIRKAIIKAEKFDIPIICVGNIYLGGTGKTPLSIFIAKEFKKIGKNPAIIRKYYKNHYDEHNLIKSHFKNLILDKNRKFAIKEAIKKKYDIAVLDDGFQDNKIHKNLNIVCFNDKLLGNGLTIPAGPLRENLKSISFAEIMMINGEKNTIFEKRVHEINDKIEIFYSSYKLKNIQKLNGKKLTAFCGIGNPDNFFNALISNNLAVKKRLIYPDHYEFKKKELENLIDQARENGTKLITTEKDFNRIKYQNINYIDYIDYVELELEINQKDKFLKKLFSAYV